MSYKNITRVTAQRDGLHIRLLIELDVCTDDEFVASYRKALSYGNGYTSMRGSGAPTVDNIEFDGKYVTTKSFPEYGKDDAKEFLNEFDSYLSIAKKIYESLQTRKKQDMDQQIKEAEAQKKKLADLNDFFNNN